MYAQPVQPGGGYPSQAQPLNPGGYGAPAPYAAPYAAPYGAPPAGYGGPAPGYGAPPAGYGAPPPGYGGAPAPGYGGPPGGYMPPMMAPGLAPGGMAYVAPVVADPWAALASIPAIVMKQKIDMIEVLTGFEEANKYRTYAMTPDGRQGMELFNLFEKSDCCERQLCGSARGFQMAVTAMGTNQQFLTLERPFKCTFLCCARPEIFIRGMDGALLGSLYNDFTCCDDVIRINGPDGNEILRVNGACCQPGKYCQLPCAPFDEVLFTINTPGGSDALGNIRRVWPGCAKEMFTDADTYTCTFPPSATAVHKALIMATVILIDYLYFEKKKENNTNNNAVAY